MSEDNQPIFRTLEYELPLGGLPGYGSDWWTEEQWQKWRENEDRLKKDGIHDKLEKFTFTFVEVPIFDHPELFNGIDEPFQNFGIMVPLGHRVTVKNKNHESDKTNQ